MIYLGAFMLAVMMIAMYVGRKRAKNTVPPKPGEPLDWILKMRGLIAILAALMLIAGGIATCNR